MNKKSHNPQMDSCLGLLCLDSATIRWYKNSAPSVHWFTKSQSFGMLGADLTRFGRIYVRYRGRRFTVPSKLWSDPFIPAKQKHIRTKGHLIPLRCPEPPPGLYAEEASNASWTCIYPWWYKLYPKTIILWRNNVEQTIHPMAPKFVSMVKII